MYCREWVRTSDGTICGRHRSPSSADCLTSEIVRLAGEQYRDVHPIPPCNDRRKHIWRRLGRLSHSRRMRLDGEEDSRALKVLVQCGQQLVHREPAEPCSRGGSFASIPYRYVRADQILDRRQECCERPTATVVTRIQSQSDLREIKAGDISRYCKIRKGFSSLNIHRIEFITHHHPCRVIFKTKHEGIQKPL